MLKTCVFYKIKTGFNRLKRSPKTLAFDPQIMGNLAQRKCSFRPKLLFNKNCFAQNWYLENSCEFHSTPEMIPKKSFTTYLKLSFSYFSQRFSTFFFFDRAHGPIWAQPMGTPKNTKTHQFTLKAVEKH